MTKNLDEAKNKFEKNLKKFKEICYKEEELNSRLQTAQSNIEDLEEEKQNLKAQRPALLADNKDIKNLTKRLKKIEEEIEINQDTIEGIKIKQKEMHNDIVYARQDANIAYKNYIEEIMITTRTEYQKQAPIFAELIKDYMVLESLRDGDGNGYIAFSSNDIKKIKNFDNASFPFFNYHYYDITSNNLSRVLKKYNIPYYYIQRIHLNELI